MNPYEWFAARRGIRRETLDAFGVTLDGDAIKFPYPGGAHKFRKGLEKDAEGGRKFWWDPPTQAGQVPFLPPDFIPRERMILAEGETDTMAVWQAMPDSLRDKVGVFGLSGLNAWKEHYAEELVGDAKRLFVTIDNDDPYENADAAQAGEKAWRVIRKSLGRKARRVKLPQGINDLAEFFMQYDWAAFEALLKVAAEPKRNYPRLDLTQAVPEVDWLVEDFLVRSEVHALLGDGGSGKSWITMALGLAIAGGDEKFIGLPVTQPGPVLYVDEELSRDLVLQRINALGFDADRHLPNLEYLWYAGVDLANEPERLMEDALEIEPSLIVIDSLSRVALGVEENSNTDMTRLIRGTLVPLARDTGAAVVFVHHTSRDNPTGARGATSIRNAADQAISIVPAVSSGVQWDGHVNIFPSKPRREGATIKARIHGSMKEDGWVRIDAAEEAM